jgi:hypothetical protein
MNTTNENRPEVSARCFSSLRFRVKSTSTEMMSVDEERRRAKPTDVDAYPCNLAIQLVTR